MFAVLFVLISTVLLSVIIHFLFKGSDIVLDVFIALLLSLCLFLPAGNHFLHFFDIRRFKY